MKCSVLRIENGDVFASGAPAQGRSGGGLYNSRFELIGICSAAGEADGWYIGAAKLKALLSEWKPTQYRSGVAIGLGLGWTCPPAGLPGRCQNPNCSRCRPQRVTIPPQVTVRTGPTGPRGATGSQGPPGVSPDLSPLIRRIEALEKQKREVVLLDGETKTVIDRESYAADEPIILDVRQLTK
jgi:hypothetical protein